MTEISMDKVCKILKDDYKIPAYVEQTGGGTATIYAGEPKEVTEPFESWDWTVLKFNEGTNVVTRYGAVAGPGWFRGPGWQNGIGDTEDFYVGPDTDATENYVTDATWTEDDIARVMASIVNTDDVREYATEFGIVGFYPDKANGAWYEVLRGNKVGALYAPMHTDGSMDPEEISEISVTDEEA